MPAQIVAAVREAFVSALGTGLLIGTAVTLIGAVVAWALIQRAASGADVPVAASGTDVAVAEDRGPDPSPVGEATTVEEAAVV